MSVVLDSPILVDITVPVCDDASGVSVRNAPLAISTARRPAGLRKGSGPCTVAGLPLQDAEGLADERATGHLTRDYFPAPRVRVTTRPPDGSPTLLDAVRDWVGYWDQDGES